ncbi:MAG: BON domain-containing protein [Holosporales bacterium]
MSNQNLVLPLLLTIALGTQGCAPALFMGAAGGVTAAASDERGFSGTMSDAAIKAKIKMKYMNKSGDLASETTVVVNQGKVLLTGVLDTPQMQIDAVRLAWEVEGVKEVVDDTRLGSNKTFSNYARDAWITTQLKSKLLGDDDVRSLNYNIHTVAGTVYLMGNAQDQEELQRVVNHARTISGVQKVISHVQMRGQRVQDSVAPSSASPEMSPGVSQSDSMHPQTAAGSIKTERLSNDPNAPQPLEAGLPQAAPRGFEAPNTQSAFQ